MERTQQQAYSLGGLLGCLEDERFLEAEPEEVTIEEFAAATIRLLRLSKLSLLWLGSAELGKSVLGGDSVCSL